MSAFDHYDSENDDVQMNIQNSSNPDNLKYNIYNSNNKLQNQNTKQHISTDSKVKINNKIKENDYESYSISNIILQNNNLRSFNESFYKSMLLNLNKINQTLTQKNSNTAYSEYGSKLNNSNNIHSVTLNNNSDLIDVVNKNNSHILEYSSKLVFYYNNVKELLSSIKRKQKIIERINTHKNDLITVLKHKSKAINSFNLAKSNLRKILFLKIETTTEKNLIQSSLIQATKEKSIQTTLNQNIDASSIVSKKYEFFNPEFSYPHQFNKLSRSSLFVNKRIKCEEPIFVFSSDKVKKNTIIQLQYPSKEHRKIQISSEKDIYIKYIEIFIEDNNDFDENYDKIPSFSNGKLYTEPGIQITRNVTIKAAACCDYYIDSNIVSISFTVTDEEIGNANLKNFINDDNLNIEMFENKDNLMREVININKDDNSEIKPITIDPDESTPMGTDGSFYTGGSIYRRKTEHSFRDDDEGI